MQPREMKALARTLDHSWLNGVGALQRARVQGYCSHPSVRAVLACCIAAVKIRICRTASEPDVPPAQGLRYCHTLFEKQEGHLSVSGCSHERTLPRCFQYPLRFCLCQLCSYPCSIGILFIETGWAFNSHAIQSEGNTGCDSPGRAPGA